jgi:TIR domain
MDLGAQDDAHDQQGWRGAVRWWRDRLPARAATVDRVGGAFINYRAVDDPLGAAAIHAILAREFGEDQVFRDCVSMKPGEHYPSALREALERVDVLVAVIGPQWLTLTDDCGRRLIDRDKDWVRLEIDRALQRKIHVIPVVLKDTPQDARMPRPHELPESIRPLAYRQKLDLSQRRFFADVTALTDRIVELVPVMVIPRLFARPAELDDRDRAPSTLLRPEHRVVPFLGCERQLADVQSWAVQPAQLAAGLVTGPSGSGRTRLAMELCDRLAAADWLAGMVGGDAPAAQIQHTARIDQPLLVVVDDVETRYDQLVALAEAVSARAAARRAPARLLLIGRFGNDWLTDLRSHSDKRVAALFGTISSRSTFELDGACVDAQQHFVQARLAFAKHLRLDTRVGSQPLQIGSVGSLLSVHAAALDAALAERSTGTSVHSDPLQRVAYRDRRHWRLRVRSEGTAHLRTADMAIVSTVATLCRPSSNEEAAALRERLERFVSYGVDDYIRWHQRLYPGRYEISAVGPGPYGDLLMATTLAGAPWIVQTLAREGTEDQIRNALTVLGCALPVHQPLHRAITDLLRVDPDQLLPLGTEVADRLENPEPFVRALATVVETSPLNQATVLQLMDRAAAAPRRHLDPLRAALLPVFPSGFHEILKTMQPTVPPELEPLRRITDTLTETVMALGQSLLDPKAKPAPTTPDGHPIIPQQLFDLYRTYSEWARDDGKK